MASNISRSEMSSQERRFRSRATQLLAGGGLLHGTLSERFNMCGKKNCACTRGKKHRSLVLTLRADNKYEQIYIPKSLESLVREWVDQDREVRDLLAKLSTISHDRLTAKKREV